MATGIGIYYKSKSPCPTIHWPRIWFTNTAVSDFKHILFSRNVLWLPLIACGSSFVAF